VKFAFFQVDPAWRALPVDERERGKQAFEEVLGGWAERIVVRTYTLVGVRGDCDMLLWLVSERLEELQELQSQLLRTPFGGYLRSPYSYLAMTKRSMYVDRYATEEEAKRRDIIVPGNAKYLFVYPFVKTRAWYALPAEERQRMMDVHIQVGRTYPDVKLNTTYSFGLDDQEFVVAFETDEPSRFLDLVQQLRESEASAYTLRDTPTFTCIATTVRGMLDALGGMTAATPQPVAERKSEPAATSTDGFVEVCKVADVPVNGAKLVVVNGEQVGLFNDRGTWYALENRCSHARGPLVDGEVADGKVTCPWHSAQFDLQTGAALCRPARGPVKAFAVRVSGDSVLVGPQQAAEASPAGNGAHPDLPTSKEHDFDAQDKKLLNLLQWEFPVQSRPWKAVGEVLGESEAEVMGRVQRLRDLGVVRQISAIFDTRRLGYTSSLVAVHANPARLDEAAAVINRHPGVSHNYRRDHYFNIWFTIAVPPGADLEAELNRLTDAAGVEKVRILPTLKLYKIGVKLDMEQDETKLGKDTSTYNRTREVRPLTERDKALIRAVQDDMPLVPAPFAAMADTAGISEAELFAWFEEMQAMGYLRRVAGILRHQKAGFTDNGMVTWKVPEEVIDEAGKIAASYPQVSHCYRRPIYEDWPYNLFSMIHARSRENCQEIADQMAKELASLGITEYAILYSTKEYKKDRVRYFVDWDLADMSQEAPAPSGD
jgi:chlorite dismutase/DNA-binding Lrp family transcriptional regulator/nitrite reductase/ring-hydroxylating ferredoxin subunit